MGYGVIVNLILTFFFYSFLGWCIEIAYAAVKEHTFVNRGFLFGPLCPIYGFGVIGVVHLLRPIARNIIFLFFASIVLVTALELLTGFLLEKLFHHRWWDYSNMSLNLNGYICPFFSLIWGKGCVLIVHFVQPLVVHMLSLLPIWLGTFLAVILSAYLFADLYVTVTHIFKWNRRLAKMEAIANELHDFSDKLGYDISKNILTTLDHNKKTVELVENEKEKAENFVEAQKEKAENFVEQRKLHIKILHEKYHELIHEESTFVLRILKAFPTMQPTHYKHSFHTTKKHLLKIDENKHEDTHKKAL